MDFELEKSRGLIQELARSELDDFKRSRTHRKRPFPSSANPGFKGLGFNVESFPVAG